MPKFVPRQRKHKARERAHSHAPTSTTDSNAAEILPVSKTEREARRQVLREELRAQQPKISGKKQKRLDKYIDTKLRKDENLELIKKLASQKVDTSLFRSAKKLGRVTESKREALSRALRERRAGINVEENDAILLEARGAPQGDGDGGSASDTSEAEDPAPIQPVQASKPAVTFGGGLKRPLEVDEEGKPVIKKRKRTKTKSLPVQAPAELEWEGFDTESDEGSASGSPLNEDIEVAAPLKTSGNSEAGNDISYDDISSASDDDDEDGTSNFSEDDDEDESITEDSSAADDRTAERKARSSAFKAWATQQRNEAVGFTPSTVISSESTISHPAKPANFEPRPLEVDPLPPELETRTATDATRKAFSVAVERSLEIQEARLALPVVAEEQKIMEAIHNNDVVVVWGATGSGKTTQVPQFLYEAGYGAPGGPTPGMIGVTQPRRVAAVSMSKRVGDELGSAKTKVSYQIRFESSVSDKTSVKFMTDGVLLREIAQDFALTKYSAIVIDEAHERSVNTDILIGMLSRIVDLRADMAREDSNMRPLKLVIMSATLRISDFTQNQILFRKAVPPLMQAEGRQYPVTIHFARRTQRDYLEEAFRKVSRGHKKLPPGGFLVFLTGQGEITALAKRLKQTFAATQASDVKHPTVRIAASEAPLETEDMEIGNEGPLRGHEDGSDFESEIHGLDDEEDNEFDIGEVIEGATSKVHILPLYSQLPTAQQLRVFEPPPDGSRLIVLATNVAETSLTIPGIRYVFDCGRAKERTYDRSTGVQSFDIGWISKASASQRAGRAGRTGPGHCYRLYSSAVYERDFEEYAEPEILRTPIEGLVLQLKAMNLQHVVNFPFPTPPDRDSLARAEKLLSYLGALDPDGKITPQGRELSLYPLSPRLSRMLVIGQNHGIAAHTIAMVAALAVPDVFIPENQLDLGAADASGQDGIRSEADNLADAAREKKRKAYNHAHATFSRWDRSSDALKLFTALCAYSASSTPAELCDDMFLREKALKEASQLREQLTSVVRTHKPGSVGAYSSKLAPPTDAQIKLLKQIVAAGFIDQVAIRADLSPAPPELYRKPKRAIDVPYVTLFPSHIRGAGSEEEAEKFVYLHPSSVLAHTSPQKLPQYIIYSHLQRSSSTVPGKVAKVRMHALTPVSGAQLVALAKGTPLLEWGKPIGKIVTLEREDGCERRECWVVPSLVGEKGRTGWPLPAKHVVQRKESGRGWVIEREIAGT
ncbi:hypothetical protein W97_00761 [Coniosporium apollinis CBS 100218]|uniref:RNA helicase n=1 Tax=Coniosporium apollinis (strain CBS 100218) TaxID=1168221 RepID=R7YIU5_CONA1|nr:uncharacterized protein W97_00761 [Coniosporium apollinis CBS 100218]EON61546.1 hypothetical protein W97_00761 [Coniosporium apollinis CBS 100218]